MGVNRPRGRTGPNDTLPRANDHRPRPCRVTGLSTQEWPYRVQEIPSGAALGTAVLATTYLDLKEIPLRKAERFVIREYEEAYRFD